jgi:protein-tyrosine phosphatase
MTKPTTINVLFVCMGNICRSPMADAVFQHMVDEAGLSDRIKVDSAGTIGYHTGEKAHHGTRAILKKHGIAYDGRARMFRPADADRFDYILTMDHSNLLDVRDTIPGVATANSSVVRRNGRQVEIGMFLHYANAAGMIDKNQMEVPDPYYSNRFEEVYALVKMGCAALLDHIRAEHDL